MVGKRVRGALYVHKQAMPLLAEADHKRLQRALAFDADQSIAWNVARIEPDVVGLLNYPDFREYAFPELRASARIELATGSITRRSFASSDNPLILHRKEMLMDPLDPDVAQWAALTAELEGRDLFRDNHLIGRRRQWAERLAGAGVRLEGHRLCPL